MAGTSEHGRRLAEEAARRGWRHSVTPWQLGRRGDELHLADRWRWPPHFDHPFHGLGPTRYDAVWDLLSGTSPGGRAFWAFTHPYSMGQRTFVPRTIAFVYAGTPLPTVSIVCRRRADSSAMSAVARWAARRAERSQDPRAAVASERLDGLALGSEEFRRLYKVEADDHASAEWLLGSVTEQRLLADPTVSVQSIGADVLAWCDHGDLTVATVDELLELLDSVALPR